MIFAAKHSGGKGRIEAGVNAKRASGAMARIKGETKVNERIPIRGPADLDAIERGGLQAFLPSATPFGLIEDTARKFPDRCALHYLAADRRPQPRHADQLRGIREEDQAGCESVSQIGRGAE